jgi:hypothetical protein
MSEIPGSGALDLKSWNPGYDLSPMSAPPTSYPPSPRLFGLLTDRVRDREIGALAFGIAVAFGAALAGYALVTGHERLAIVLSVLPLAVCLLTRPTIPLVFLGASIPALASVTGGGTGAANSGGYNAAVSDVLLVLVGAGILLSWMIARPEPVTRALRPIAPPVLLYSAVMLMLLAFHPGLRDLAKTGQRFELFLLPLIVGAFAALTGWHIRVLKAYVLATTVLAVVWPFYHFGQHNPVGQLIANAILLLVAVRALRGLFPCLVLLVPGLVLTVSRGAIAGGAIGLMVIFVLQRTRTRPIVRRLVPLALLAVGAFAFAPSALQTRVTTFSPGTQTAGEYAIYLRAGYSADAHRIIDAHPWTGVGIGNYGAADALSATPVQDPHQVLLLQEAEGGYILGASFVLLIIGVMFALRRIRQVDVAPAAAGVLIATVAHGLVDVYWVRGTPVLGWLLVGMACGGLVQLRRAEAAKLS